MPPLSPGQDLTDPLSLQNRTLLLHIGAHKTGSSSIQHFLLRNRRKLRRHNWEFIRFPESLNLGSLVYWEVTDTPHFRLRNAKLDQLAELFGCTSSHCIASAEDLFLINDFDEIKRLKRLFDEFFADTKIITYLRRQDSAAVSMKAEGAKTQQSALLFGNSPEPLPDLTPAAYSYLDYSSKIELWTAVFGKKNVNARIYDRNELVNEDVVSDFLNTSGLPITARKTTRNMSLSGSTTAFLHHIRSQGVHNGILWPMISNGVIRLPKGEPSMPSRTQAFSYYQNFKASNLKLEKLLDRSCLFPDTFDSLPLTPKVASIDDNYALENCLMMIAHMRKACVRENVDLLERAASLLAYEHPQLADGLASLSTSLTAVIKESGNMTTPGSTDNWRILLPHIRLLGSVVNIRSAQVCATAAGILRSSDSLTAYRLANLAILIYPQSPGTSEIRLEALRTLSSSFAIPIVEECRFWKYQLIWISNRTLAFLRTNFR